MTRAVVVRRADYIFLKERAERAEAENEALQHEVLVRDETIIALRADRDRLLKYLDEEIRHERSIPQRATLQKIRALASGEEWRPIGAQMFKDSASGEAVKTVHGHTFSTPEGVDAYCTRCGVPLGHSLTMTCASGEESRAKEVK